MPLAFFIPGKIPRSCDTTGTKAIVAKEDVMGEFKAINYTLYHASMPSMLMECKPFF